MTEIIDLTLTDPIFNGLMGGSKIRGGIDVDIAKSAFQKAIRRGEFVLAWTMGLRLHEFIDVPNGKSIRSNLINRLPVICGEDIGLANLSMIKKVDVFLEILRDDVYKKEYKTFLIELITFMCASKKSRLVSHVNATYYEAVCKGEIQLKMIKIENNLYVDVNDNQDRENLNIIKWLLHNAKDDEEKMGTWYYMKMISNSNNKYKISRGYPKKRMILSNPIFYVWNMLLEKNNEIIDILYKFYLYENENHIYLNLGLLTWFYNDVPQEEIDINSIIDQYDGIENIISKATYHDICIPEYAIDKHTKKGKMNGKNSTVFALEGSLVTNKPEWMRKWDYLEVIYKKMRGITNEDYDEIVSGILNKEQVDNILKCPNGQILTSSWKKYVFIPKHEEFVYKGPWNAEEMLRKKDKMRKLKFRFDICKKYGKNILIGEILKDELNQYWIKYPRISSIEPDKWIITSVIDKINNKMIDVVDRKSMGFLQLSYFSDQEDIMKKYLFEEYKLYCDLILLYLLNVGDTGLYNILISNEKCYIIDIDDDTTKTEFSEIWHVFGRKPSSTVVDVISKCLNDEVLTYLSFINENLENFGLMASKYKIDFDIEKMKIKIDNVISVIKNKIIK
jgi:hypothetical protein